MTTLTHLNRVWRAMLKAKHVPRNAEYPLVLCPECDDVQWTHAEAYQCANGHVFSHPTPSESP